MIRHLRPPLHICIEVGRGNDFLLEEHVAFSRHDAMTRCKANWPLADAFWMYSVMPYNPPSRRTL